VKVAIQAALAKVEEVVTGAVKIIAQLTYRQRYTKSSLPYTSLSHYEMVI